MWRRLFGREKAVFQISSACFQVCLRFAVLRFPSLPDMVGKSVLRLGVLDWNGQLVARVITETDDFAL